MKLEGKKVAVITENGFEEVELTSPVKALKDAGATVHIISPQKDKVKAWDKDHWSIEVPVDVMEDRSRLKNWLEIAVKVGSNR